MRAAQLLPALAASCSATSYKADLLAWDRVLKAHVNVHGEREGIRLHTIDYCGIRANPDYKAFLKSVAVADVSALTKNETYAIYMNAYNAFAMNVVISHPTLDNGTCIRSFQDLGGPADPFKFFEANTSTQVIGGRVWSLNNIEDFLRDPSSVGFEEDARVHACIVCDSISCPNVRAEAYLPEKIDAQMDDNIRDWLTNPLKGTSLAGGTLTVSKIFSWFADDFVKAAGSVAAFIAPHAPPAVQAFIAAKGADAVNLSYFDYDWDVNGEPPCACPSNATRH